MRRFDVFNGDADGVCALHQLRLAEPAEAELVTGLKRDIALLARVPAVMGDEVTVLDVSLERNREALDALLERGVRVRWFDHHFPGPVPSHPGLEAVIDESGEACTSVLVDRRLDGRFRAWAVVGAFGDNLAKVARELAAPLGLDEAHLDALAQLGASLNYNAYGEHEADQLVGAADLYRIVHRHADPFRLLDEEPLVGRLARRRAEDLALARAIEPMRSWAGADAWLLPHAPWSRRVIGEFANTLAASDPRRAHAVLSPDTTGGYTVSVRSPDGGATAVSLCRRFSGGGGRSRAAGIEHLELPVVEDFLAAFARTWKEPAAGAHP